MYKKTNSKRKNKQSVINSMISQNLKDRKSLPETRPFTTKAKNIHTQSLKKTRKSQLNKLLFQQKFQNLKVPKYLDCQDIINITPLSANSIPCRSNPTPKGSIQETSIKIDNKDFAYSDFSDESASVFYPNEPKIHFFENKSEKKLESLEKKKIFIKKPKIVISSKGFCEKIKTSEDFSKFSPQPMKNLIEMIKAHSKLKPKGRVRRGLCINLSKSPVPKVMNSIKLGY